MNYYKNYEMVIGLEVHCELKTETKIFCSCPTTFGAEPNTQCCPVCTGMPGALPVLNGKVVDYAITAGLATGCAITAHSKQDRKNYFYPDLPKAYQISQFDLPLCVGGHVDIVTSEGEKRVGITRIHIEEDAGKLIHDPKEGTLVDCNRCGVPLIEIVSEPDIRSAEEALAYLRKLRAIILYTGISDVKMNEGSLRADVNLSVRPVGESKLGTRTEMKNLNSFAFIGKAIEYEYKRQVDAALAGEVIVQETRRFDPTSGKTFSMRKKENANDYRYFPDPDLMPIITDDDKIARLRAAIPQLPDERSGKYVREWGLSPYDAEQITLEPVKAEYFERAARLTEYKKTAANLFISDLAGETTLAPEHLAELATLSGGNKINSSTAKKVLSAVIATGERPETIVERDGLWQINDAALIEKLVREALAANPRVIEDYKKGKTAALRQIVGAVMKSTGGRANPEIVEERLSAAVNASI